MPQGDKLHTFKRGIHQAEVYCLNFNFKSNIILLSSNAGTIHLFKMVGFFEQSAAPYLYCVTSNSEKKEESGWSLGGVFKSVATLFVAKDKYEDIMESAKSFMQLKNQDLKGYNICALSPSDTAVIILKQL